jgi:type I restriction enzyme S subunit
MSSMLFDLPDDWRWAGLAEVAEIGSEQVLPNREPDRLFNYVALENVESGTGRLIDFTQTRGADIGSNKFRFTPEHILYGKLRPYLRKALVPDVQGVCATDLLTLRPNPGVLDRRFLWRWLLSPDILQYVVARQTGVKMPRLRTGDLQAMPVPLPPLVDQLRIIERIEQLLAQSHAARVALERVPALLKQFRQAVLAAAFRGELTERDTNDKAAAALLERIQKERQSRWAAGLVAHGKNPRVADYPKPAQPDKDDLSQVPDGWVVASIDQLTSSITSGSRDWKKYYGRGTGTFIMAQNVKMGRLDMSFRQPVDPPTDDRDRVRSQVKIGDLLVTIVGANTGDVCEIKTELPEHYVCQSVALLRPLDTEFSDFLEMYLTAIDHGQQQFKRYIYGAGRPHLSFEQLKMTPILLPPVAEQRRIVARIGVLFTQADAIERAVEVAGRRAEKVDQAILARAFRGEL